MALNDHILEYINFGGAQIEKKDSFSSDMHFATFLFGKVRSWNKSEKKLEPP